MATTAAEKQALNNDFLLTTVPSPRRGFRSIRLNDSVSYASNALTGYPRLYREISHYDVSSPSQSTPAGSEWGTRVLNVVVAAIALVITSPLLLMIALAVKLTSKGPVFYSQTRVGLDRRWKFGASNHEARHHDLGGRPFTMFKFRTMVVDAEKDGKEVWAARRDPRITAVGKFLRGTRLDELPQLINVLSGNMNVVGPRPERPTIFAELRNAIPDYHLRQRVMPGITGWAQVNQSYDTCVDDVRRKVDFDLEYVRSRSVVKDLKIMARTLPVMALCDFGW